MLAGAGLVGGAANAMAGGATLITFPAMMAAGLPAIVANASNAVAVSFGNLMGAWAEREKLPRIDSRLIGAMVAAMFGGLLGGILLLATPERLFVLVVPALIGLATLVFAFAKPIQTFVTSRLDAGDSASLRALLVVPASAYGGYFGAGLGVILMAVLSATSPWDLRSANAVKNVLSVLTNAAAIVYFVFSNVISWPETVVMLVAALAGGYAGGRLLKILPSQKVRQTIIIIGSLMTVFYAWRYWL